MSLILELAENKEREHRDEADHESNITSEWRCCKRGARIRDVGALPPTRLGSCNPDVARASQLQHTVERMNGDRHLGPIAVIDMRA